MSDARILHIGNGESAADKVKAEVPGDVLVWRDVLYEGPVPGGLGLEALSRTRLDYLESGALESGADDVPDLRRSFELRDAHLSAAGTYDRVVLWFEHDLYDQLQVIQLLDWLDSHDTGETTLEIICINQFPGIEPFYGLGQLLPEQFSSLYGLRVPISDNMLKTGSMAWAAFRSRDPVVLVALLREDLGALPFLKDALLRFLEEFPAPKTGLGRTQRQILELLEAGPSNPAALFINARKIEEAPFMGDWSFWRVVSGLTSGKSPLATTQSGDPFFPGTLFDDEFRSQRLELSDAGRLVLDGQADNITLNGIDRWFGGVHMVSGNAVWRWESGTATLTKEQG